VPLVTGAASGIGQALTDPQMDAELHRWTAVDVLPVVCKQRVRGLSPLNSGGQGHNSNSQSWLYSSKVQQP
jgi:hypothetical protein